MVANITTLFNDLSIFDNCPLEYLIPKERELRITLLAKLEEKAESQWLAPNLHTNISEKYFRPSLINKISNHHNLNKWATTQSEIVSMAMNGNYFNLFEHRYTVYLANSYYDYLINKGSISPSVDEIAEKWAEESGQSTDKVIRLQYLFDISCYFAGKIFELKIRENRFSDDSLIGSIKLTEGVRDARKFAHEAHGRASKLAHRGKWGLDYLDELKEVQQQVLDALDNVVKTYVSSAYRLINTEIGLVPTLNFPTNYREILAGK